MDRDHGAPGRLAPTKLNHPQPDRSPEPDGDGVRAGRPDPVGIALGSGIPVAFTRRVTSRRKAESAPESAWSAVGDDNRYQRCPPPSSREQDPAGERSGSLAYPNADSSATTPWWSDSVPRSWNRLISRRDCAHRSSLRATWSITLRPPKPSAARWQS